jgi:DNA-binding MarR family transcriptional regulator
MMVTTAQDNAAKTTRPVRQLISLVDTFREVTSTMSLAQLKAFLLVATNEGKSLGELAQLAGGRTSTMSRYLLDFSDKLKDGSPGYGLIYRTADQSELRRNVYVLSPSGHALLDKALSHIGR